ncbi:hypothetical protein PVK06_038121 [Gossypium arboreum]|uniref:Reverse transcriptase n=1 Tax=Gossypium arboreum TaxID=29729 RepID=A0ABR0N1C9_GOSAR|nr:hypothetical protein PVK06_038121 [Gossypium arboreum]
MGKKGFMAVKLDMSKAYDRIEWEFIKQIMIQMGFANRWVNTIMQCVTTVSYSMVMNGHQGEKFQLTRGLCQGDPLSPFLFLLCGKGLSSLLRLAERDRLLRGVKTETKKFFRKLWKLQLPSKITIIIWRISWNYIPTLGNLRHRRLVTNARCPREFKSSSGLVVRGLMNEVLALKSIIHRNVASLFAAETFAGLEAVKLGIEMGLQEIQIMGDSLTVIKKCHSTATDYLVIGAIIRDIQSKKPYFQKIEFKHIQKTKKHKSP